MIRATLPMLDVLLVQQLAALSWERETGGTLFNCMPVATDVVS